MALRADVVVPSSIAFLFGTALGLVLGWLVSTGGQAEPDRSPAQAPGGAAPPQGAPAQPSAAQREIQLREALVMHEELLANDPDNPRLLRTIGEYHAALGEHELALAQYAQARGKLSGSAEDQEQLSDILFDEALSFAEINRYREALDALQQAEAIEPRNTAPKLIQVYIYMNRIMIAPPPGFDRLEALGEAERLLAEILAIDPSNADALQMKAQIDAVRRSRPSSQTQPAGGAAAP